MNISRPIGAYEHHNTVQAHLRQIQHDLLRLIVLQYHLDLRVRYGQPQQALPCVSCLMHGPGVQF